MPRPVSRFSPAVSFLPRTKSGSIGPSHCWLKNVVQPALVLGGLVWLGYGGGPIVAKAVLTTAIPTMPIVIVLAVQYQVAEVQASSTLFLSVISSIVTMGVFIAVTQQMT